MATPSDLEPQIEKLLSEDTRFNQRPESITKLAGEASTREYYRIQFREGPSLILMKMPYGYASISEEITKADKKIDELPFLNIQKYLKSLDVPVPEIVAYAKDHGLLLLEDLGNMSLEKSLKPAGHEIVLFLYKKALELLVKMQRQTAHRPQPDCIAFHRKFDCDLLAWEMNHFLEYGIEDRLETRVEARDKKVFDGFFHHLSRKIRQMPQGFVHRDFQSRNLFIHGYTFYLIDFQDALLGPQIYDLVSLLRDSYVELTWQQIEGLIEIYWGLLDRGNPYRKDKVSLGRDFNLITIQRKLKDAGRFQYIKTVKKNADFLKHVPASLAYVKEALRRQGEYGELYQLLGKYLPEFK